MADRRRAARGIAGALDHHIGARELESRETGEGFHLRDVHARIPAGDHQDAAAYQATRKMVLLP